jgi:cell division protein FtsI (penicillin-binding protein 3)
VASFAGYVPADRPRLAILVVVDEPKLSQYGGTVAAPVFAEVAEATLRYMGVPPSIPSRTIEIDRPLLAAFSQPQRSVGPATAVPDLRGLDARAAIAKAVASGLTVRAIGSGVVISQEPEAGGALPQNRRVTVKLSGPHPALRAALSPQSAPGLPSPRVRGEGGRRPDEGPSVW